ncbi:hypothetical protein H109_00336 [Trichophyton interdigitale MR816]|uniref:Uncharacterized protein n=1 Tax=Trichophyton interdigitale (strain MR816) TaxID=1215338 RepID=A0A059JJ36_TRIIM|nr:hypothetical protein H101_03392 [Trichophyton interdigitale H6]KDB27906.1 hypothetical protein H109_00336 [Trichophyton interdigitale MR816]
MLVLLSVAGSREKKRKKRKKRRKKKKCCLKEDRTRSTVTGLCAAPSILPLLTTFAPSGPGGNTGIQPPFLPPEDCPSEYIRHADSDAASYAMGQYLYPRTLQERPLK